MFDETEAYRRERQVELNVEKSPREKLSEVHGQVWDTQELQAEFEVTGFMAPYIVVRRKSDGKVGSLEFQHSPRYYFNWKQD